MGGGLASYTLRRVDEDDLGVLERFDLQHALLGYGRAVARPDADAVDLDAAESRHEIEVALRSKLVFGGVPCFQGGAEDAGYSSGYKVVPKNAYFDAPGELRLVRGMSDAHLRAFGDKISIYGDGKVNVLSAPIGTVEALIYSCAQQGEPLLFNATWMQETLTGWEQSKALGILGGGVPPTPDGLIGYLDSRGLVVTPQCKDLMGTESHNFTVRAIAQVGEVTRTMTTVMRVHRTTEEFYYYAVR